MSHSLDGLESASLMRHGSRKSYTSGGDMSWEGGESGQTEGGDIGNNGSSGPGSGIDQNTKESGELDYVESEAPLLSQFHEDAIQQVRIFSKNLFHHLFFHYISSFNFNFNFK